MFVCCVLTHERVETDDGQIVMTTIKGPLCAKTRLYIVSEALSCFLLLPCRDVFDLHDCFGHDGVTP